MSSPTTDRRYGLNSEAAIKIRCMLATTANITLSGEQTIDGTLTAATDVLVKNQTNQTTNGIYTSDTGTWTRRPDFDDNRDALQGTLVAVIGGTANSNTAWRLSTAEPVVFGSSAITFTAAVFSDSASVNFLQSGTGAVARTMQAKERDIVSVKDFGAKGDGATDDTAAIQAAINSFGNAYVNSSGGIYFPRGTYLVSSTIVINNQTGFALIGAGKYLTTLQATAGLAGLPIIKFIDGAYCPVKGMSINGVASGSAIDCAIRCQVSATIQPTPQGMIFEELYIDGLQTGGFNCGIRFTADVGQDNNNESSQTKNCDFSRCATAFSIEHYNSLVHQIFGGSIGSCGVGISTAVGGGGSFSANGVKFISNTVTDFDIGYNATHSSDIVNCKNEGSTALWIRCLVSGSLTHGAITGTFSAGETVTQATSGATGKFAYENSGTMTLNQVTGTFDNSHVLTGGISGATTTSTGTLSVGRQDINVLNSTWHGTLNNSFIDYRGSGRISLRNCQMQPTGSSRTISTTNTGSSLEIVSCFMDVDTISYTGKLMFGFNTYAGSAPTLSPQGTSSRLLDLDTSITAPVVVTTSAYSWASNPSVDCVIANFAGTVTLVLPNATLYTGRELTVRTIQAQTVVSDASNVVPLAGGAAGTAILAGTAGKWANLKCDGNAWQITAAN